MNKLFDITGNVTVITGGTGVLGRTIAKYLALEGAKVIILGRKEDVGSKIAADICAAGGVCEFMKTDVMDAEVVKKNCEDILAKYAKSTSPSSRGTCSSRPMPSKEKPTFNLTKRSHSRTASP